uniref:Uncharacterized protein n=1 Tax=Rhizophora mucronata TaxID=61149 RepID=A0A2P2IKN3_RHIMU
MQSIFLIHQTGCSYPFKITSKLQQHQKKYIITFYFLVDYQTLGIHIMEYSTN